MFHVKWFDLSTQGLWVSTIGQKCVNAEKRWNIEQQKNKQNSRKMFKEMMKIEKKHISIVSSRLSCDEKKFKWKSIQVVSLSIHFVKTHEVAVVFFYIPFIILVRSHQPSDFINERKKIVIMAGKKRLCGLLLELTSMYLFSIITTKQQTFIQCTFMVILIFPLWSIRSFHSVTTHHPIRLQTNWTYRQKKVERKKIYRV